jgi:hypothetical protein
VGHDARRNRRARGYVAGRLRAVVGVRSMDRTEQGNDLSRNDKKVIFGVQ